VLKASRSTRFCHESDGLPCNVGPINLLRLVCDTAAGRNSPSIVLIHSRSHRAGAITGRRADYPTVVK
jgi:hypothetical protein